MNQIPRRPIAQAEYADLEIRILERRDGGYPVEITLNGEQEFPRGYLAADAVPWVASGDPAADGHRLFDTLLSDSRLKTAWAEARGQHPQRRIRLRIDRAAAGLHTLPWELLHEEGAMLAAQANTPFSRYLPIALPWSGPVTKRPIRVLVLISNPTDLEKSYNLPSIDVVRERERLEVAFAAAPSGDLKVVFLEAPATLERLEEALSRGDYHVVHYLGHGAFFTRRAQAVLYLQDQEGSTRPVVDDEISSMLTRQGIQPRLVFLAACQSATRSTADAFLGMAPKLVSAGVPAVVAMQDRISVDSAQSFSSQFYQRLLEHGLVDLAVNQARSRLLTAGREDAAVPVLLMRLRSGQLWGAEADARGEVLGSAKPRAFWTTLMRQIEERRCTPIVGPRVHGGPLPTWPEIAQRWAEEYDYPFTNCSEMASVAQYMDTYGGKDFARYELLDRLKAELVARLPEELRPDAGAATLTDLIQAIGWQKLVADNPNEAHRVLADLDLPLYLTTNADSFMVEALKAGGREPVRALCRWSEKLDHLGSPLSEEEDRQDSPLSEEDDHVPTAEQPLVYHFLGSDEKVKSLVVTEDHFFTFLVRICGERDRIPNTIRGALASTSLMFVGYSLYDWEFRVLMHGLVHNLSQRLDFQHVAVQLEPAGRGRADTRAVQTFLERYFHKADIDVYWGSPTQFAAELREQWEGRQR